MDEALRARAATNLALMRADKDSDWPHRLLEGINQAGTRPLTQREHDALECLSRGMTIGMAADSLNVAASTIHTQLKSARYKLGAKNTTHAVAAAIRRGIIP